MSNDFPLRGVDMSKFDEIQIPEDNEVYWEPWIDAYDNDSVNSAKSLFQQQLEDMLIQRDEEADEIEEDELSLEDEISMFEKPIKTIITPFGVLPLTEESLASSHFKFWVGHSNFKILKNYIKVIENCKGVESVDILTPYRFRIAVGKLFRDRSVMSDVRGVLLDIVNNL
jgi:hypothetical protein